MIFPHIQELTMSNLDQMHATQCIHRRIERVGAVGIELNSACTQRENIAQVHARTMPTCGVEYPRTYVKSPRRKIRMDFSPISGELTGKQVGRGRFVNLQVNEIKRKEK